MFFLYCSLIRRLATSLLILLLATPASAEQLDSIWQIPRDIFNELSDQACEGDDRAYRKLVVGARVDEDPVAMSDLAWLYRNKECSFSEGKSALGLVALYKRSAEAGYPIAQSNYAEYLMEGDLIPRDPSLAKEYLHRAIDAGYGNAAVTLGLYYLSAEFLPIDDTKARSLYNRARKEGSDTGQLEKLAAELEKIAEMSNAETTDELQLTEIDGREKFFTESWGFGYGQARWDYVPNGKFESRVYVGVYEDSKQFYLGMMRDTNDPIIRLLGVSVEYSDERINHLDLSFCQTDTCDVTQYGDNFGHPGSWIDITLPLSKQRQVLDAVKSGSYIIFRYETKNGIKNNTLSLKGSRKAIEKLEQKHNLSSGNIGASQVDDSVYRAAIKMLTTELNLIWSPKDQHYQAGRQVFTGTETTCVFRAVNYHPNTGKTIQEFDLGALDPNQITWPNDLLGGKTHFLKVRTLNDREASKVLTEYPDGTTDVRNDSRVDLYIGEHGNFDVVSPLLAKAIRHCN
jgi:hypothetical protein